MMNIRGKSSPVQSNIRTVTTSTGQTPPPASQLRGSHFEDPSHYPTHFQGAGAAYQTPQQTFVEMNKPASGRVSGQGLAQAPQGFNVPRGHVPYPLQQGYNLVGEGPDQPSQMWNQPQQGSYYMQPPMQSIRQPRMPAMNNNQVAFVPSMSSSMHHNMAFIPGGITPGFSSNQGFVQNPGNQYMQYQQARMTFPPTIPQQQQMNFMPHQYGATSNAYPNPGTYYQPHMPMPNTGRPSSAGPQGAVGGASKSHRNKKVLSLTDPNTGEDLTDKVFKPASGEEMDPSMQEVQAHREAVHLEFATKVAFLAKDKNPNDVHHPVEITPPPAPVPEAPHHPVAVEECQPISVMEPAHEGAVEQHVPVINGQQETNIPKAVISVEPPAPYSAPEVFKPSPQPTEMVAAAPEVQTPPPALAVAPVMPVDDSAATAVNITPENVSPPPEVEVVPPAVAEPEKEATTPLECVSVVATPSAAVSVPSTSVSAAEAAAKVEEEKSSPPPVDKQPQQAASQAPAPQPQRQDGKRNKKNKKDLNKKTKEGSDMDAFYDTQAQTSQESGSVAAPTEQPAEATPQASTSSASTPAEAACSVPQAAAASLPPEAAAEPTGEAAENTEVVEESTPPAPSPEASSPVPEVVEPAPQPEPVVEEPDAQPPPPTPEVEVEEAPKEEPAEKPAPELAPEQNGVEGEDEGEPEQLSMSTRLPNGLEITYETGQWSPANPEGKKQYGREFLLKLQANPESRKAPNLPDMPEIVIDPRMVKEDIQKAVLVAGRPLADFTPGFFKSSYGRVGQLPTVKRNSQQRGRGGPGSQTGDQQPRVITSIRQDVQLHKSDNAYKPLFQKDVSTLEGDKETEAILRLFKGILNKLTPQKFEKLVAQVLELKINTEARLTGIGELLFEKAIAEQKFSSLYASLCYHLLKLPKVRVEKENEKKKGEMIFVDLTFRAVLLTKCQKEFEKDNKTQEALDVKKAAIATADEDKKAQLKEEYARDLKEARHRSIGNIRFIGELFRLKMLTENIMQDCIHKLIRLHDEESIECLTELLETVGPFLETNDKSKLFQVRMAHYYKDLAVMAAEVMPEDVGKLYGVQRTSHRDPDDQLSRRVKFGIINVLERRQEKWRQRNAKTQNKPTTIEEIHKKARQEQQEAQFLNSQPRPEPAAARGNRGKGRGMGQGDLDGWNTVPTRQVKQQIDATRMKLTKNYVDESTLTLGGGNKFQNWSRGSQGGGGGSKSQEQEKMGNRWMFTSNRYTALNNLTDGEGRRGYGRSPARNENRMGGARSMGGDRDRRDRDRDRDYRKTVGRSSMEERDRAVANTRSMLGASSPSNPSSRNASRDNSRTRDLPPQAAGGVPSGIDVSQMTPDELARRLNTIAEELHSNGNIKETCESIVELIGLDYTVMVTTMLEKLLEKPSGSRRLLGQFLFEMVKERHLSIHCLNKGIVEFLQFADDLEIDIPRIWDNLAEIFAYLVMDNKVLPLCFLLDCMPPLDTQRKKFVPKIFNTAAGYKSREAIQKQWAASGLKLSDFKTKDSIENELQWLKGNVVYDAVRNLMQKNASNEEVFKWIDQHVSKQEQGEDRFVRQLIMAICEGYCNIPNADWKKENPLARLKTRTHLMLKFVDSQHKETQALVGIQILMDKLEHPSGLANALFNMCYDEDIVSEDSFFEWKKEGGPGDAIPGKRVMVMALVPFWQWFLNEEQKS